MMLRFRPALFSDAGCALQDPGDTLQRLISPSQTMAARASVMGRPPMRLRFNLDYCTGFVLAMNLIFICVELELQGRDAGHLRARGLGHLARDLC